MSTGLKIAVAAVCTVMILGVIFTLVVVAGIFNSPTPVSRYSPVTTSACEPTCVTVTAK